MTYSWKSQWQSIFGDLLGDPMIDDNLIRAVLARQPQLLFGCRLTPFAVRGTIPKGACLHYGGNIGHRGQGW